MLLPSAPATPRAHAHRQGRAIQQLLVIALAAEVVEILMRQAQMGQLPLAKGRAMAGIPDGGQLADAAVVALLQPLGD